MNALINLAIDINREHQAAFCKARDALEHARRAGELLLQAKATVRHGEWLPWLSANAQFGERTAQSYMRLASHWPELEAKSASVADLPLRDALRALAEPDDHHELAPAGQPRREIISISEAWLVLTDYGSEVERLEAQAPNKSELQDFNEATALASFIRENAQWIVDYCRSQRGLCSALIVAFEHPDMPKLFDGKPTKYAIRNAYRCKAWWTEKWIEHSEVLRGYAIDREAV